MSLVLAVKYLTKCACCLNLLHSSPEVPDHFSILCMYLIWPSGCPPIGQPHDEDCMIIFMQV